VRDQIVLHRAPWVLPVVQAPLANGAVAVRSGRIEAVGGFSELQGMYSDAAVVDYPDSVLIPALINAHTHLELSNLAHITATFRPESFTGWIENMLAERRRSGFSGESVLAAAAQALSSQQQDGVIAVGDISNTGLPRKLSAAFWGELLCFKEFYGLSAATVKGTLQALTREGDQLCTAHAPYSTHAEVLQALKQRSLRLGHVFPLHVAEPPSEAEMMNSGRGEIADFFHERGFWSDSFQPTGIDNTGSVQYLHQLGILDDRTLCVHCIHVSEKEFAILQTTGCSICLCPGSNRYLNVGKAPVVDFLRLGIHLALGTDSLSSNPVISLWREMFVLTEDHPGLAPADILRMATLGGSKALGLEHELGSLEKGKRAAMLAVVLCGGKNTVQDVMEELVSHANGRPPLKLIGGSGSCVTSREAN